MGPNVVALDCTTGRRDVDCVDVVSLIGNFDSRTDYLIGL